jgi:hypothetical protein
MLVQVRGNCTAELSGNFKPVRLICFSVYARPGVELLTFECPKCKHIQTAIGKIESRKSCLAKFCRRRVRFWRKADIPLALTNVRFWGTSGHYLCKSGHQNVAANDPTRTMGALETAGFGIAPRVRAFTGA